MITKKDYYEILGVGRNASQDEIKRAYRKMARKWHPDVNPDNKKEAERRFKEINEAFEILGDENKRAQYDRFGHSAFEGGHGFGGFSGGFGGFSGFNFEDLFRETDFGDIFDIFTGGRSRSRGPAPGADLKYDLTISLEDAFKGVITSINIPVYDVCSSCDGTGAKKGSSITKCDRCNGTGEIKKVQRLGPFQSVHIQACDKCDGEGKIIKEKCSTCNGLGREKKQKDVEIKIPAGIYDGAHLRVPGMGEPGTKGGENGDLYVVIHIEPHDIFERKGDDLFCNKRISIKDAVLGGKVKVKGIDGEEIEIKIPEGTESHTVFRVRGKGMSVLNRSSRGDLFVKVVIDIPKRLTKRQKEAILEFDSGDFKQEGGFFDRFKTAFS